MGLLMIDVAEPVTSQSGALLRKIVDEFLPAINPVIMDSMVLNPLLPPLDDSTMALVRS